MFARSSERAVVKDDAWLEKNPQARSRTGDGATVGHRMSIQTDMHTLLEESRWARVSRALLLGALPLSMLAFASI